MLSHTFLLCANHAFILFLSCQEKKHHQVLLWNERQSWHSRVCIKISSSSTVSFCQCIERAYFKLLLCPVNSQAQEEWEHAAEHSENEHSQLIRLLSKEHKI